MMINDGDNERCKNERIMEDNNDDGNVVKP